jgi:tetratricopeptide (TPR) repeat protein
VFLALGTGLVLALRAQERARGQLARTGETLEALATKIFDLAPTLGFSEEQRGDLEDVLARVRAQLALEPENRALHACCADALFQLGLLDQAQGDHAALAARMEAARALREELVRTDPGDFESRTQLAQICAKLGEVARARGERELLEDLGWSLARVAEAAKADGDRQLAEQLMGRQLEARLLRAAAGLADWAARADPAGDARPELEAALLWLVEAVPEAPGEVQLTSVEETLSLVLGRLDRVSALGHFCHALRESGKEHQARLFVARVLAQASGPERDALQTLERSLVD